MSPRAFADGYKNQQGFGGPSRSILPGWPCTALRVLASCCILFCFFCAPYRPYYRSTVYDVVSALRSPGTQNRYVLLRLLSCFLSNIGFGALFPRRLKRTRTSHTRTSCLVWLLVVNCETRACAHTHTHTHTHIVHPSCLVWLSFVCFSCGLARPLRM